MIRVSREREKRKGWTGMTVIQIVETATGNVVREIDVTGKSENQIEKTERGILINMDMENYFTRTVSK